MNIEVARCRHPVRSAGTGRWRVLPLMLLVVVGIPVAADGGVEGIAGPEQEISRDEANKSYFTDLELITHQNRPVRFYTDLLRGKVVGINFFFTSCTTVCPPLMGKLSDVQVLLGDRLGRDIALVSISVDPERDTPEVIKSYAELFGVRPGWTLLTGERAHIDEISRKLGNLSDSAEHHTAVILVGNPETGHWQKLAPTASVRTIARQLQLLATEE